MKRRLFYIILMCVMLITAVLYNPQPAMAKAKPRVVNFETYVCNKQIKMEWEGYVLHVTDMINENVTFQITDKKKVLYSIDTKYLWVDITFNENWESISSKGAGFDSSQLVKGNGGWQGYSIINWPWPGQDNPNLSEQGTLYGTGSLKGKMLTFKAYGGYKEPPPEGAAICEGHGDYIDFGTWTATIYDKNDQKTSEQ